jgi:hypothetical protein
MNRQDIALHKEIVALPTEENALPTETVGSRLATASLGR